MRCAQLHLPASGSTPRYPPGRIERRSPTRPRFASGWRKEFAARTTDAVLPRPAAGRGLIEIWTARPKSLLKARSCLQVLDDDDRTELGKIANIASLEAAVAGRILLRLALSHVSNQRLAAAYWRFARLETGKLQLAAGLPQINFSLSHCDALVGVAVSHVFEVGLDIESVDSPMSAAVKDAFLTHDEQRRLSRLHAPHSLRGAIRIWTLKEAFSKLLGAGFASEFQAMDFRLFPEPELVSEQNFPTSPTHFESLYIEGDDNLYLTTLAVAQAAASTGEIQFLNLIEETSERPARASAVSETSARCGAVAQNVGAVEE